MHTATILNISPVEFSDHTPGQYIEAALDYPLAMGVQPSKVSWVCTHLVGQGQKFAMTDTSTLSMLNAQAANPWKIFGSDHHSGEMYYGSKEIVDLVAKEIDKLILTSCVQLDSKTMMEHELGMLRFDFVDGTSMILFYFDAHYLGINTVSLHGIKGLLNVGFGAHCDDILLHERVRVPVAKLLGKIKSLSPINEEVDWEDQEDSFYDEFLVEMNKKKLGKNYSPLMLGCAWHLLVDLMQWDSRQANDYPEPADRVIIEKMVKSKLIESIPVPQGDTELKMVYCETSDEKTSHKQYTAAFEHLGSTEYVVKAIYGRVGGKLKEEVKLQTTDRTLAQRQYMELVRDKLSKGYSPEDYGRFT